MDFSGNAQIQRQESAAHRADTRELKDGKWKKPFRLFMVRRRWRAGSLGQGTHV
jgi:hypothetical protein